MTTSWISKSPQVRYLIVCYRVSATSLYTSLQLQIPYTCSPPTPRINSTLNRRHIQNPVEHL